MAACSRQAALLLEPGQSLARTVHIRDCSHGFRGVVEGEKPARKTYKPIRETSRCLEPTRLRYRMRTICALPRTKNDSLGPRAGLRDLILTFLRTKLGLGVLLPSSLSVRGRVDPARDDYRNCGPDHRHRTNYASCPGSERTGQCTQRRGQGQEPTRNSHPSRQALNLL